MTSSSISQSHPSALALSSGPTAHALRREAPSFDRRRFLQTAWGLGALACPLTSRLSAATPGRVLLGFQVPATFAVIIEGILTALQGRYQPDLGTRPVMLLGGSGALSVDAALKAPADGATALIAPSGFLTLLPEVRKMADDPVRRLVPVAGFAESTVAFIVGPNVPPDVRTMTDYFSWVRDNPIMGRYAVPGLGTAMHFVGREVMRSADGSSKAVNYRGPQPMLEDVAAGSIPAAFTVVPDATFMARNPTTRVLGVSSDQRWPTCPEVPTFMELGLMKGAAHESLGFFFAEGTPTAKVDELAAAIRAVVALPQIIQSMNGIIRPMPVTGRPYAQVLADERTMWVALARRVDSNSPG